MILTQRANSQLINLPTTNENHGPHFAMAAYLIGTCCPEFTCCYTCCCYCCCPCCSGHVGRVLGSDDREKLPPIISMNGSGKASAPLAWAKISLPADWSSRYRSGSLRVWWRDQGYGYRKGDLFARLMVDGSEPSKWEKISTTRAPHQWTTDTFALPADVLTHKSPNGTASLELGYVVGGGGGHRLFVQSALLSLSSDEPPAPPPAKVILGHPPTGQMQLAPVPQQMEQQTEGELEKLSQLKAAGVLDNKEFESAKAMVVEQAAQAMILAANQASPAFVIAAEAVLRPEAVALADLRAFFTQFALEEGNSTSFSFDTFSKMCNSLKVELRDQRKTFEMLDVDRSGRVSFDEFLYAMAGRYMAHKGELDATTACKQCLSDIEGTLHSLQEHGKIKEKTSVEAASRKVHLAAHEYQEGHGKGVTVGEYMLACAVPCYLCYESRGKSVVNSKRTKLTGMEAAMDYTVRCKDANVGCAPADRSHGRAVIAYPVHAARGAPRSQQSSSGSIHCRHRP